MTVADAPLALEAGAQRARPRLLVVGTALAAMALGMMVAGVLAVYATLRDAAGGSTEAWVPRGVEFANAQLVFTVVTAVGSSLLVHWAAWSNRRRDETNTRLAVLLALLFGGAQLNMMLLAVDRLGVGIGSGVYANLVFPIAAVGVALTALALVYLAVMAIKVFGGQVGIRHPGLSGAALFWDFQVVAWLFIFFTVFVVK